MDRTRLNSSQAQWHVLSGAEAAEEVGVDRRPVGLLRRVSGLQASHVTHPSGFVWGSGRGCLDALWLAEQYDVQMLVLEGWPASGLDRRMERACRRNLFAVVCPVAILAEPGVRVPALPNARTYVAGDEAGLYEIVEELLREQGT